MKKPIIIALIAALPIELVSFSFYSFQDTVYPLAEDPFEWIMDNQWRVLHFPGLWLTNRLDLNARTGHFIPILLLSGYIDTALLILLGFSVYRGIRYLVRKDSAACV